MSKTGKSVIGILIVAFGLFVLNYPTIAEVVNHLFAYHAMSEYQQSIEDISEEKLQADLETAHAYNAALPGAYPTDPFSEASDNDRLTADFGDFYMLQQGAVLGYLEIPSISLYLPVRYGTSDEVLQKDLGLVENSSLPVGGAGTHAVISGHTGMASRKLFTDLNQMREGDVFFLHVLNLDMAYRVDQILVVWPYETDALGIDNDKDYVTLLTCTPFGINDHRLLVRGERIDYDFSTGETAEEINTEPQKNTTQKLREGIAIASAMLLLLMIIVVIIRNTHDRKRRGKHETS